MAHVACLDENNIVQYVIVVDNQHTNPEEWTANFLPGYARYIQTSYNAKIRKNFAGVGFLYREDIDAFIPPLPEDGQSWVLNTDTGQWELKE